MKDHADVAVPAPVVFGIGLGVGWCLERCAPLPIGFEGRLWVGLALIGLGLVPSLVAVADLMRAKTAVLPHHRTTALRTSGVYAITRNPIYLGMAVAYGGAGLSLGSSWALGALVPVIAVMNRWVIAREERYLARLFGAEYETYRRRVRRWL
ncbi:MAG: isoprenylcysteine carboxylmethyltransferase family protein [Fimbriimonadaceae bacterium]|nr:isoprenylcysteine carboxylmethyltransferase family protein [Fimbriimonadaceae bacterium]